MAPRRGRPPGSKSIPWGSIVERLRKQPNRWVLLPEMARVNGRTINVIRKRERRALRLDDGVIRCRRKVAFVVDDTVIVTLFLKFEPKEAPPHGIPQADPAPH
ncbi:hypothetical protein SEA_PHINKY_83 [Microbacterium phage Phinky]|nr:hypothetical protein SEA_PHINKY_83 [Microbacterium phage Phinky]